jgi:hypothetical protein
VVEEVADSLARPLGGGDVGPIEPPPRILRARVERSARARWLGLGAFAITGATGILVASGVGESLTADMRSAFRADLPDAPQPKTSDAALARDTVFAVHVAGLPTIGPSDAMVTLVVVTDYGCVGCERARPMLESLRGSYGDYLRIVYKPKADAKTTPSALGACAAALQNSFQVYDQALWRTGIEKSRSLGLPIEVPDEAKVMRVARDLGLDLVRFASNVRLCEATVRASTRELAKLRIEAPAFFVNGRLVDPWGIEAIGTFQSVIDEELVTARRRIAAGTTRERYYEQWVVDAGHLER